MIPLVSRTGAYRIASIHRARGDPLKRNDATYVCLERVLVELSVYMGNGWF